MCTISPVSDGSCFCWFWVVFFFLWALLGRQPCILHFWKGKGTKAYCPWLRAPYKEIVNFYWSIWRARRQWPEAWRQTPSLPLKYLRLCIPRTDYFSGMDMTESWLGTDTTQRQWRRLPPCPKSFPHRGNFLTGVPFTRRICLGALALSKTKQKGLRLVWKTKVNKWIICL